MDGDVSEVLTFQEELRRELFEVVDRLRDEINRRFKQLHSINEKFGFIQLDILMNADQNEFIKQRINALVEIYDEIDGDELKIEVRRLRKHVLISRENNHDIDNNSIAIDLLKWIVKWGFTESLPNLSIVLRIFLTMCISIASCERSFSKLKLVKTYLRSTMSQIRLTSLAILSIEREITNVINFDTIINDFAALKSRKVI